MTVEWGVNTPFICPKVSSFVLENNPDLYEVGNGQSFNLVVNTCSQATQIDQDKGLETYSDEECLD